MADEHRTTRLDPTRVDPLWPTSSLDDDEPDPSAWLHDPRVDGLPEARRGDPAPVTTPIRSADLVEVPPPRWEEAPAVRRPIRPARPATTRQFDAGRLWAGGVATALVAGLLAIVGVLSARGLLDVAVLAPKGEGTWGNANTFTYSLVSAACALAATGLVQVLLATTPNATRFFGWIMVLLTAIAVVLPLSLNVGIQAKACTAVLNFLIGVAITLLLRGVAASARRKWDTQADPASWRGR